LYEREGAIAVQRMLNEPFFKRSAASPVRPFGVEPAEPALAAGAPPDAPTVAPARVAIALAAVAFMCTAIPVFAAACPDKSRNRAQTCPTRTVQQSNAAPTKKAGAPLSVIIKSRGGGRSFWLWPSFTSDLMP
jgi:hypothetical protein